MWFQLYIYIYLHLISTPDDAMKTDIKNTLPFLKNYKADSMNLHLLMVICFKIINRPQLTCCRSWRSTGLVVTWVWSARLLSWRMARFKKKRSVPLPCFKLFFNIQRTISLLTRLWLWCILIKFYHNFICVQFANIWGQVAFLSKTSYPSATIAELVDVCAHLVHCLAIYFDKYLPTLNLVQ